MVHHRLEPIHPWLDKNEVVQPDSNPLVAYHNEPIATARHKERTDTGTTHHHE